MATIHADLLIIGGGLGGCAAAISACDEGLRVLLTEETDWIGGQSTSQGVPPDEHPWIEDFGATKRYQVYRGKVRETYLRMMDVKDEKETFNPGNGLVSNICHDPRVSVHVLNEMLLPYVLSGQLTIELNTVVTSVERSGDQVDRATYRNVLTGSLGTVEAFYFIDATEAGDVLPLAEVAYVTGAEAISETNEPHAVKAADPKDIQA
ncbi:FAD-dependent oxidoreductase, partial [Microvirga sp. 3-52]|nr:FAD-dependent oxidoreductase [Microvirga sp. 3-52]